MRDRSFDDFKMAVVALNAFVVKIGEMFIGFLSHIFMPLFAHLLQQEIPFGIHAMSARCFITVIAERIARGGPPL